MAHHERRITDLWWLGIRLWYNEQDFLQAMQVWDEAIEVAVIDDDDDDDNNNNDGDYDLVPLTTTTTTTIPNNTTNASPSSSSSLVAPLMIFLAGCYLDAGEIRKARKLCRRCIGTKAFEESLLLPLSKSSSLSSFSSSLAACAISEYTATFHEDKSVSDPCNKAYQITKWAIDKQQQQHFLEDGSATTKSNHHRHHQGYCWVDPYQRPGYFYPFLKSKAVYPREDHPDWCRLLEDHFPTVREEFLQQIQIQQRQRRQPQQQRSTTMPQHWPRVGAGDHRDGSGKHDASVVNTRDGGDWRELVLFGSGARPVLAPKTCRLLEQIAPSAVHCAREGVGEIIFSVLAPRTHIAPHCASTNLRLTAHMGIQVPNPNTNTNTDTTTTTTTTSSETPEACYIQVAGQKLKWEEGKIIVFDDSYQHEVHNNTNEIRAVLLMRFWHPKLDANHRQQQQDAISYTFTAKEIDQQQRCNPPLPPRPSSSLTTTATGGDGGSSTNTNNNIVMRRNQQGMKQQACPNCGASGYESIRLIEEDVFVCLCGREVR